MNTEMVKKNQFVYNGNSIILNNNLNKTQYNYEIESSALLGLGFKSQKTEINRIQFSYRMQTI